MYHISKALKNVMKSLALKCGINSKDLKYSWLDNLMERAIRQRKCHTCSGKIKGKTLHFAQHTHDPMYGIKRYNICVLCLDTIVKTMKRDYRNKGITLKSLIEDRKIDNIIEEL